MKKKFIKFIEIIGIPVFIALFTAMLWANNSILENKKDIQFLYERIAENSKIDKEYRKEDKEYRKQVTHLLEAIALDMRNMNINTAKLKVRLDYLSKQIKYEVRRKR